MSASALTRSSALSQMYDNKQKQSEEKKAKFEEEREKKMKQERIKSLNKKYEIERAIVSINDCEIIKTYS